MVGGGSYDNFAVRRKERSGHRSFLRDANGQEKQQNQQVYHYRLKYNNNYNVITRE
jgi:hypothetical protein